MPVSSYKCFDNGTELLTAIDHYLTLPIPNSNYTTAINTYGPTIGDWCVGKVTNFSYAFANHDTFNQPLTNWNTSSAVDVRYMFANATTFNQPLDHFSVDHVVTFDGMFSNASSFDQDVSAWNVGKAQSMASMFAHASSFQQDLCDWGYLYFQQTVHAPDTIVTNMFAQTTCPSTSDPVLLANPPGPFCFSCDWFFLLQVTGHGFDANLTAALRPIAQNIMLAQFQHDFGSFQIVQPGQSASFNGTAAPIVGGRRRLRQSPAGETEPQPERRRQLITIRTCPKTCSSASNAQSCVWHLCTTSSRGTKRQRQLQQRHTSSCQTSLYDASFTQHTMNELLIPVEQTCGIELNALCQPYNDNNASTDTANIPTPAPTPRPSTTTTVVQTCPLLANFSSTAAPTTLTLAPAAAPCPALYQASTLAPTSAPGNTHACFQQVQHDCLDCTKMTSPHQAKKCAKQSIQTKKSCTTLAPHSQQTSVLRQFVKKYKTKCHH